MIRLQLKHNFILVEKDSAPPDDSKSAVLSSSEYPGFLRKWPMHFPTAASDIDEFYNPHGINSEECVSIAYFASNTWFYINRIICSSCVHSLSETQKVTALALNELIGHYVFTDKILTRLNIVVDFLQDLLMEQNTPNVDTDKVMTGSQWGIDYNTNEQFRLDMGENICATNEQSLYGFYYSYHIWTVFNIVNYKLLPRLIW